MVDGKSLYLYVVVAKKNMRYVLFRKNAWLYPTPTPTPTPPAPTPAPTPKPTPTPTPTPTTTTTTTNWVCLSGYSPFSF